MTTNFPELDPFAVERSHRASHVSNENSRATAQACILINGGAATAALAFLAKGALPAKLITIGAVSLTCYAVGVFMGALMMFCISQTMENWNLYWLARSYTASDRDATDAEFRARKWWGGYHLSFILCIVLFVVGSGVLGVFLYQNPNTIATGSQSVSPGSPLPATTGRSH